MKLPRSARFAWLAATLVCCWFSNAAPAASFKFPTQTLTVPDGFSIELVAAPPMVNRPISIAYDPQGRLYATDSSGLSERADKQMEQKPHRIVRLEDTDGDGRFDQSTVFAENMMFPQGALFYEGSLYVAADRQGVTDTWTNARVKAFIKERGIQLIGYRDLK